MSLTDQTYRLLSRFRLDHDARVLAALTRRRRYDSGEVQLGGMKVRFTDGPSVPPMYRAIFEREVYRFPVVGPAPRILDCGANIGLATLYFKRLYPTARIDAFEPDPEVYEALAANCGHLSGVNLHRSAVWTQDGSVSFTSEGGDAGRVGGDSRSTVRCEALSSYMVEPVDFLKLDIEGSELEVLQSIERDLHHVSAMFVEVHHYEGAPTTLPTVLDFLTRCGFRYVIDSDTVPARPFLGRPSDRSLAATFDVYATR